MVRGAGFELARKRWESNGLQRTTHRRTHLIPIWAPKGGSLDLFINRPQAEGSGSPRPIGQSAGAGCKPELPVCEQVGSIADVITAGASMLFCPELKEIAEAWAVLPESFRAAVLGIVRSGQNPKEGRV